MNTTIANQLDIKNHYAWSLVVVLVSATISAFVSLQAGVFLLLFAAIAWWSYHNPREAIIFFIVIAPILPLLKITQTIGTITLLKDVIILTLFIKLVALPLLTKKLPYRRNVVFAPIVALVFLTALNTLRANSLILGILRARDIILYILLFFAVLYLPPHKDFLRTAFKWFLAALGIILLLGLYQWVLAPDSTVLRYNPALSIWIPRLSSILAHPSIYGHYLITAATLLFSITLTQKKYRWYLAAVSLIILLSAFVTYSRAVWFGLFIAIIAIAAAYLLTILKSRTSFRIPWRLLLITLAVLVLALVLVIRFTSAGAIIRSSLDPTYGSNVERLEFMARLVAPITNTEAMIGGGLGDVLVQNFRQVDLTTYDIATGASRTVQLTKNRTLVDNQYLKTFVEMGLLGLLVYFWLYWRLIKTSFKQLLPGKNFSATKIPVLYLWCLGFLAAFIVQAAFIDIWDVFPTNAAFWIIAALVSNNAKA